MVSIHQVLVVALTSVCWLTSCLARDVPGVRLDSDDLWPVLCPRNTFYSRDEDQCLVCSQCPLNKIITFPCHGLHDTKCGPFYFKELIPADRAFQSDKGLQATQHNTVDGQDDLDASMEDVGESHPDRTPQSATELTDPQWMSLRISLFVFLSFFAISILVVSICIFRRKNANGKKMILDYSPPTEDV